VAQLWKNLPRRHGDREDRVIWRSGDLEIG
jgi:hypothetical protein